MTFGLGTKGTAGYELVNDPKNAWPPVLALDELGSMMSGGVSGGQGDVSLHDQFVAQMEGHISVLRWATWESSHLCRVHYFLVCLLGDGPYKV